MQFLQEGCDLCLTYQQKIIKIQVFQHQINDFESNGYLIVKSGLSTIDIQLLRTWTEELLALPEESGKHWVYHENSLVLENKKLVSRIENITPFHSGFRQLAETLKYPIGQLLGEEAVLFKEKVNFKMPGANGFQPHQDSQAGWNAYADFFISVLISIDDATLENGCLEICDGYHKRRDFTSWEPLSDDDTKDMSFVPIPTRAGDLIFFDSFTPHQSAPNKSKFSRRIYYATYNRLSAGNNLNQYYKDKHKFYPPDIDRKRGKKYAFRV